MKTARRMAAVFVTCSALMVTGCGGGGGDASCGGATMNFAYDWTCNGNNCPDTGTLSVKSQNGTDLSGFLILCIGNNSCQSFCYASQNTENAFTGTVSGNCINLTSTDGTWSAHGVANGNNMTFTIATGSSNCLGAQTKTVTLGR